MNAFYIQNIDSRPWQYVNITDQQYGSLAAERQESSLPHRPSKAMYTRNNKNDAFFSEYQNVIEIRQVLIISVLNSILLHIAN